MHACMAPTIQMMGVEYNMYSEICLRDKVSIIFFQKCDELEFTTYEEWSQIGKVCGNHCKWLLLVEEGPLLSHPSFLITLPNSSA